MRKEDWQTWSAAFDAEWRDDVDPPGAGARPRDDFVRDMRDLARSVVECAIEPLRSLASTVPDAFAIDCETGAHSWRAARPWRTARRWRH